ncbi:topoisomerase DNA-binding C4 zinc finger domain-containing protein [Cohnella endophytica]|nr:topoisomerase DNA-binding C4 zinc finger domain-containing protein [Cohnella endophytica]
MSATNKKVEKCAQCGGDLLKRKSSKGEVIACSNYPICKMSSQFLR